NTVNFGYTTNNTSRTTSVVRGIERHVYREIDDFGRVGQVDAGDTSINVLHETQNIWDSNAASCTQPVGFRDNNLCQVTQLTFGATPNRVMQFLYNQEGQLLRHRDVLGSVAGVAATTLDRTYGYHAQYFDA